MTGIILSCLCLYNDSIFYRAANKGKESKRILEGDKILSSIRGQLVTSSFSLLNIWKQLLSGEEDMSMEKVTTALQCSIVLAGSAFASLSSFRRYRFRRVLKHDFAEICKDSEKSEVQNLANFCLVMI